MKFDKDIIYQGSLVKKLEEIVDVEDSEDIFVKCVELSVDLPGMIYRFFVNPSTYVLIYISDQ
jgi:hypothetical protein